MKIQKQKTKRKKERKNSFIISSALYSISSSHYHKSFHEHRIILPTI